MDPPGRAGMVEAPGTAPGSATLISHVVYRHSRRADIRDYRRSCRAVKDPRSQTCGHGPSACPSSCCSGRGAAAPGRPDLHGLRDLTAPAGREPARSLAGQAGQGAGTGRCPDRVMQHDPASRRMPVPAILQPPAAQAVASGRSRNADEENPQFAISRAAAVPGGIAACLARAYGLTDLLVFPDAAGMPGSPKSAPVPVGARCGAAADRLVPALETGRPVRETGRIHVRGAPAVPAAALTSFPAGRPGT